MLKDYINSNNCFKLIIGANNEDLNQITKLVYLYSLAGCKFFDINATNDAIKAAKEGLKLSNKEGYLCASVGTKDDAHFSKCKINTNLCINCKKCIEACIQNAIKEHNLKTVIEEKKCIGCKKCSKICKQNAIEVYQKKTDFFSTIDKIKNNVECIEFHIVTNDEQEIFEKWNYLVNNFSGYLSIALNRTIFSNKKIKEILDEMLKIKSENVMIQADGSPMSGSDNNYNTTLQAVACADIIRKNGIKCPVIVSGGTNCKTRELINLCNINIQGIAIGSWARKSVSKYLNNDKDSSILNEALDIAQKVVNSTKQI